MSGQTLCEAARAELARIAAALGTSEAALVETRLSGTLGEAESLPTLHIYFGTDGDPTMSFKELSRRTGQTESAAQGSVVRFQNRVRKHALGVLLREANP